jgi:thiol:disulfide interchange protein DsbD
MNLSGSSVDYLVAFFGGVLVSFTPCVYPLIPISAGYIGVKAGGSKLKGLTLSLVYVSGVAVTYSILGLLVSLTGTIFGTVSINPITRTIVGILIILFGLSMFGLFHIHLPNLLKLPTPKKEGYFSTFFLGLTSGLMVSPCITPVLGSILAYLATKNNLLYGAALLFSFAYGMGLSLIIAGTFSTVLVSLPKSGRWLTYINKAWAFILVIVGLYFVFTAVRRM